MYRRFLCVFLLLLVLTGSGSAVDQSIFLRRDNERIFSMNIFVEKEVSSEGEYVYSMDYFLDVEKEFDRVASAGFTVSLVDSGYDPVLTNKLNGWAIKGHELTDGTTEFRFDEVPDERIIFFRLNYTAERGNEEFQGTAEGGFTSNMTFLEPEVGITGFPDQVSRGDEVVFNVSTKRVGSLDFLDGSIEKFEEDIYTSRWKVPQNISSGSFSTTLSFRGGGRVFEENVSMEVTNSVPEVSTGLDNSSFFLNNGSFVVNVVDDSPSYDMFFEINGSEMEVSRGTNMVSDIVNESGEYGFSFRVTDSDNASVWRNGSFSVKEAELPDEEGNQTTEEPGSEQSSERIPVFGKFREFFTGFFGGHPLRIFGAVGLFIALVFVYVLYVTD